MNEVSPNWPGSRACLRVLEADKVRIEKMTNDDNLESSLPTSSLLKMCSLVQVELCVFTAWWQEMN